MGISFLLEGPRRYCLVDDGSEVAWIDEDAMEFRGFATRSEAERAADAGYARLLDWLRSNVNDPIYRPTRLHAVVDADGRSEWIGPDGRALTRLVRPEEDGEFTVALKLPLTLPTTVLARAASNVYDAMRRAGHTPTPSAWATTARAATLTR
jgi:hypothetical protein